MKKLFYITMFAAFLAILTASNVRAQGSVNITAFSTSLEPYGTWVEVVEFGTVWVPRDMPLGWRPYTLGHWIYTDYGWTWVSDLPWGWAPFHYGRWTFTPEWGWVWVPDTVWGPAWVTWRYGDGMIGWAPLHPFYRIGPPATVSVFEFGIIEERWVFVDAVHFLRPRINTFILAPSRNAIIITRTANITQINIIEDRVINRGPALAIVEQLSRSRVPKVRVEAVSLGFEKTPANKLEGLTYRVLRPDFSRHGRSKPSAMPGKEMQRTKRSPERKDPTLRRELQYKDYGKLVPELQEQGSPLRSRTPYSEKRRLGDEPYSKPSPHASKGPPSKLTPTLKTHPSDQLPIDLYELGAGGGVNGKSGVKPAVRSYGGALFK